MTNTITDVLAQLAPHPEIQDLVQSHFGPDAGAILQGVTDSSLGRDQVKELEALITDFMADHADEVASFKGIGTSVSNSSAAMANLQAHHPQAAALMQAQANKLERLLGKDRAAMALGQKKKPFYIKVLCWNDVCVVTAEEFEEQWFNSKEMAIASAEESYEPFIQNFSQQEKLVNVQDELQKARGSELFDVLH